MTFVFLYLTFVDRPKINFFVVRNPEQNLHVMAKILK